jgi:hypothetical protein
VRKDDAHGGGGGGNSCFLAWALSRDAFAEGGVAARHAPRHAAW